MLAFVLAAELSLQSYEVAALPGLRPCTTVAVQMVDSVDSGHAQPGDFFRFRTINAVTAGNRVVIPTHTMGYGVVAVAEPAGRSGRAGALVLEPRYLVLPGGRQLGVVLDHATSDLDRNGRSGDVPGLLGAVPALNAAVGIFNFFHWGENIAVRKGTIFSIFPADIPRTARCQEDGSGPA